jgi:competence protein ComEC
VNPCKRGRNDNSVVLSLSYKGRKILLTGDIEEATETTLVQRWGNQLRSDVLKVAHHGSFITPNTL